MQLDYPAWHPIPSPHFSKGRDPGFPVAGVVQHYTAAGNGRALARWLSTHQSKVSAHIVICRDGHIIQQVEWADRAWHAGELPERGFWKGEPQPANVNHFTIGVENSNYGRLTQVSTGRYVTSAGRPYRGPAPVRHVDHRGTTYWWEPYTDELVDANIRVLKRIVARYPRIKREDVLAHSEVSPHRKSDPGPLWPKAEVLDAVFGPKVPPRSPYIARFDDPPPDEGEFRAVVGRRGNLLHYDEAAELCRVVDGDLTR